MIQLMSAELVVYLTPEQINNCWKSITSWFDFSWNQIVLLFDTRVSPSTQFSVIFSLFMILAKTTVYVLMKSGNGEQKWRQNVQYCVSEVRSTTRPLPSEVSHHLSGLLSEAGDSSQTTQQNHSLVLCIPLPSHHECIPSLENCQRSCRWHDPELH